MRHHLMAIGIYQKGKKKKKKKCCRGCRHCRNQCPALLVGGKKKIGASTMKNIIDVFQKLRIELLYDPDISLLGVYLNI